MTGMFIDVFSGKTSLPPKNNGTAFKFSPLYYNQRLQDNYLQNSAKIPTTSATENPASGSNSQFSTTEEETNDSDDVSDKKFDTNYTMANITIQDWDQCVAGCMDNESVDSWRALADLPVRSDKSIDFDSCCFSR